MSHEDFNQELNALRENLPELAEEAGPPSKTASQEYSIDLANRIVDWVAQGKTLSWVSQQSEMPAYSTLLHWSKSHPELSKMLRSVRDARARHFEDAAIDAAENAHGKDADRLKVETYKWAAEVNDPTVYGKKVAHSGEVGHTVKIVKVVTGFGPLPEALRFPKLNADGTICKDVPSEVASVEGPKPIGEADRGQDARGHEGQENPAAGSPGSVGHADASGVRGSGDVPGVSAL